MSSHHEVERTYSPEQGAELPDLAGAGAVAEVGEPVTVELDATYLDTVDLRLTRAGISLRRRTGGDDAGWHLKLPAGEGRDEERRALGRGSRTPPKPLRDAVLAWTLGAEVAPVAVIATRRTTRALTSADGRVLAEVSDDETSGGRESADETTWREVEVELVDGGADVLDAVEERLVAAGFAPSAVGRKIELVLADVLSDLTGPAKAGRKKPAGRVLHARLVEQVEELRRCESEVRRNRPDAVHRTRVAARRVRSALRTFAPLLDTEVGDALQRDLRRLVVVLGPERDAEVAAERIEALLAEEDPALVLGPVRTRLRAEIRQRMRAHRAATTAELASPGHLGLLAGLDRLVADPPWSPLASRKAGEVLPGLLDADRKRLAKRFAAAEDEDGLHRARAAAKRLRYAAEALAPAYGTDAERLARTAQELQRPLGTLQDTRVARALLLEVAAAATAAGESSFSYGRWFALEESAAAAARGEAAARWLRASKRRKGRALRLE